MAMNAEKPPLFVLSLRYPSIAQFGNKGFRRQSPNRVTSGARAEIRIPPAGRSVRGTLC